MYPWGCCRTCLAAQSLHPIFPTSEQNEKYSNIIFTVTGIKVEINDSLPQEMCSACINFINESIKFRRKCEQTYKHLLDRLNNKQFYDVKVEMPHLFKIESECPAVIDITESVDDNFNEDDNITLEELRYNSNNYEIQPKTDELVDSNKLNEVEFETRVQDLVEKPIEIIFNNKRRYRKSETSKVRSKKRVNKVDNNKEEKRRDRKCEKEKGERVKEEIECEYCHKILTSKLSLRNHYKIHTGFDVVCEHCGKKFITRRLLLMHCRAKHGYEKTDKCSYCDYRASNAEQVKIHERLHTGEKPYVCKECNAGFHRKSSYLQHIAIHLPEKTVQCDQCPARFKSVTLMRIHKSRHRPPQYSYRCVACGNSFARRRNVARHLQRIHGLPPEQQHIDRLKIG